VLDTFPRFLRRFGSPEQFMVHLIGHATSKFHLLDARLPRGMPGVGLQIAYLKAETLPQQYGTAHTLGGAHAISASGGWL
jgi:hypothetical protein